ncbi:MAG: hypothetical protein ACJA1Y_001330, partial [Burkholderiaceae bacterium]
MPHFWRTGIYQLVKICMKKTIVTAVLALGLA